MNGSLRLACLLLLMTPAYGDEVHYTKNIEYDAKNPCTGEPIQISGEIRIDGRYHEVGDAYRFEGRADFSGLRAREVNGRTMYESVGAKDNKLAETIDVPSDTSLKYSIVFEGPGKPFQTTVTFRFSVNLFGGKDIDVKHVTTECNAGTGRKRSK